MWRKQSCDILAVCGRQFLVKQGLLGVLPLLVKHVTEGCQGRTVELSLCDGSILGVTVYRKQWYLIPSHQLWERCLAVTRRQDGDVHHGASPHEHDSHHGLNLDSSLKTTWFHLVAVQLHRARHHSKRRRQWLSIIGSTRNGLHDTRCPSARHLAMVPEDTGARCENSACVWTAANEAVGSTGACHMMWQSSR
ncbi:uncharacterized protein TNCV_4507241 [Trichonephila clavipes]|nr:uncharacterized protein TNCV_4507241 [Trichonephila clavipes]